MAQYLAKRHPSMVCVDAISPDGPPFPFHKALFKEDVLLGENLINLGQLQDKSFTVYAFPLKVTIEAAPARIVASIE
jgi:kynurenine formamidase